MNIKKTISKQDLLKVGAHYGHKKQLWHPKMSPYIYGVREGIHIISLEHTLIKLYEALDIFYKIGLNRGNVLFVNTKKQSSDIVKNTALKCNQYYINQRWLGGTLTNWSTISISIKKLKRYEDILSSKDSGLNKKEKINLTRKKDKLERSIGGIKTLSGVPDILFVNDVKRHKIAVEEAVDLNIPVVAVVDTNSSPENVSHIIPGNDDSRKSIEFFSNQVAEAILLGMKDSVNKNITK